MHFHVFAVQSRFNVERAFRFSVVVKIYILQETNRGEEDGFPNAKWKLDKEINQKDNL